MLHSSFKQLAFILLVALCTVGTTVQAGPPKVKIAWDLKVKKDIELFKVFEKNNHVFVKSGSRMWLFNGETGKEIWKKEFKKYVETGLHRMIDEDFFLVTTKAGLVCLNLDDGQEVWTCDLRKSKPKPNYKKYTNLGRSDKGLVLNFDGVFVAIDIKTGAHLWSQKIKGVEDWSFYGDNILVIKAKSGVLVNSKTGNVIREIKEKFSKDYYWFSEVDGNILVFLKDGAKYVRSSDGVEVWHIDDEVDNFKEIYKFKAKGETFGVLALKKQLAIFNMTSGEVVRTKKYHKKDNPDGVRGNIEEVIYFEEDDLIGVYTSKRFILTTKGGCHFNYYKINRSTGEVVSRLPIVASQMATSARPPEPVNPALGFGAIAQGFKNFWKQSPVSFKEVYNDAAGRVLLVYGTKVVDAQDIKTPAEGIYKIKEVTGEIVWKTLFRYEEGWDYRAQKDVLEPVISGDIMYIYSGDRVRAFNLVTGAKLWESEARKYVSSFSLQANQVVATHGLYYEWPDVNGKIKSKKKKPFGLFAFNAADGKSLWSKENLGERLSFDMATIIDTTQNKVYYCDGKTVAAVDFKTGADVWTYDAKKAKLGKYITRAYRSGVHYFGEGILLLGTKKVARIDIESGKEVWNVKWKYKATDMTIAPMIIQNQMIYELGKTVYSYNMETGVAQWKSKESKTTNFVLSPNLKFLYSYDGKKVKAIDLTN